MPTGGGGGGFSLGGSSRDGGAKSADNCTKKININNMNIFSFS
jgi:hypothetical protein